MTVAQLENTMSADEFNEWREFYSVEPFGEIRNEMRNGLLASTVANVARSFSGGDSEPLKPLDFMYFVDAEQGEEEENGFSGWEKKLISAMTRI